jgi:hypothetical protein
VVQADDLAQVEVLQKDGGPRLSARGRRLLVVAAAVLCVVGVVAWRVDARVRDRDEQAVAACHDAALQADTRASGMVLAMVQYIEPALYAVPADRRDGLVAVVAEAANRALPGLRRALQTCRGTSVAWLHRDLTGRRAAYIDYLDARIRRLEAVAADGNTYYRNQPHLAELRARAFDT